MPYNVENEGQAMAWRNAQIIHDASNRLVDAVRTGQVRSGVDVVNYWSGVTPKMQTPSWTYAPMPRLG